MDVSVAIVDDDESSCRSLARLLRQGGFRSSSFLSAEEYLASPLQKGFTCLVIDFQLGGMSGPSLHRRLLQEGDRTPVIYITAHEDSDAAAEAQQIGCAGFFRKSDPGIWILDALRKLGRDA